MSGRKKKIRRSIENGRYLSKAIRKLQKRALFVLSETEQSNIMRLVWCHYPKWNCTIQLKDEDEKEESKV